MKIITRTANLVWVSLSLFVMQAGAQQKAQVVSARTESYSLARETVLHGTVVKFTESSSVAPFGPHVIVHTSSGDIDAQLGNPRLLEASHFSLNPGDAIRIIGENVSFAEGSQFLARQIEKSGQTLVLRSPRGFPLQPPRVATNQSKTQAGGVL